MDTVLACTQFDGFLELNWRIPRSRVFAHLHECALRPQLSPELKHLFQFSAGCIFFYALSALRNSDGPSLFRSSESSTELVTLWPYGGLGRFF